LNLELLKGPLKIGSPYPEEFISVPLTDIFFGKIPGINDLVNFKGT
jgi:hypothetical protein